MIEISDDEGTVNEEDFNNQIHAINSHDKVEDDQIDSRQVVVQIEQVLPDITKVNKFICFQRILIVDDEKFNLDALTILLELALKQLGKDHCLVKQIVDKASNG